MTIALVCLLVLAALAGFVAGFLDGRHRCNVQPLQSRARPRS